MDATELPLGFGFALVQNPDAMKKFSSLPEERQRELLQTAGIHKPVNSHSSLLCCGCSCTLFCCVIV